MTETNNTQTNARTVIGKVTSTAMDKTITVLVSRKVKHPRYGKYIKRTSKMHAHDANNQCSVGDRVLLRECKPFSKLKTWMLLDVLEKAS